jgi:hypothetical protein
MKISHYFLLIIFSLLIISFSCKKVGGNKNINYAFQQDFKVDTISYVGEREFVTFEMNTNIESYLALNDFTINNIKEAKVISVELSTVNTNQDLNYFKNLSLRMTNDAGAQLIFANAVLQDETVQKTVSFVPETTDLKEFFKLATIQFTLYGINDLSILPSPVDLRIKFNVDVTAGLGN